MSTHTRSRSDRVRTAGAGVTLLAAAVVAVSGGTADAQTGARSVTGSTDSPVIVGFVEGHGEPSLTDDLSAAVAALAPEYKARGIDLADGAHALDGVAVLVMAGAPDVPDAELYQLDQFLMRGGGILYLLDAADIPREGLQSNISEGNIFGFLSAYGVTVNADLVLDPACAPRASLGRLNTATPYPFWPVVGADGLSRDHVVTAGLDTVRFSWTSSITTLPTRKRRSEVLARSSSRSWTVEAYADLGPGQEFSPAGELAERALAGRGAGAVLAVALEGTFDSAFAGQKVIVQTDAGVEFIEPDGMVTEGVPARMVVFGNSLMFTDELTEQFPGSASLIRNAVDWLAEGAAAAVRTAEVENGGAPSGTSAVPIIVAACVAAMAVGALLLARASRRKRA